MAPVILTNHFRISQAELFIDSVGSGQQFNYYVFLANPVPTQTNAIPDIFDDTLDVQIGVYRNLILGKVIQSGDVCQTIPNIPWEANTAYAMFDDGNPLFWTSNFFAIVNAGTFYHCWKVLDNNMGANSMVAPNIADIDVNDQVYETSDGYRWKYMFSVDEYTVAKFATPFWFPLAPNTAVSEAAVAGAIDVIHIESIGEGYNNWITGSFSSGDIEVAGNATLYSITGNTSASQLPGFYTGSIMYISSGTGVGSYETIIQSFANPNGTFVVLANPLAETPQNGSQYEIYPEVVIASDGQQTGNARARALINNAGNTVYRVEMLARGSGYQYMTANVVANSVVGVLSTANVRPIFGPYGGHGYNAARELGANSVSVSVTIANSESNTLPATNDYQQIGIMAAPYFTNAVLNFQGTGGTPILYETGYVLRGRFLTNTGVITSLGNNILTSSNGAADAFNMRIAPGDTLYLQTGDSTQGQIVDVTTVTNSSYITLEQNCLWSCTSSQIYLANISTPFVVANVISASSWAINNVTPGIQPGSIVIGANSGATGVVATVERGGIIKSFDTFLGLYSLTGNPVSGAFIENEKVFQGISLSNSTANASLFAAIANSGSLSIYMSNVVGIFSNVGFSNTMTGANSGAVAQLNQEWSPEVAFGSGSVLYINNIDAITRSGNTSDNITVVLNF